MRRAFSFLLPGPAGHCPADHQLLKSLSQAPSFPILLEREPLVIQNCLINLLARTPQGFGNYARGRLWMLLQEGLNIAKEFVRIHIHDITRFRGTLLVD